MGLAACRGEEHARERCSCETMTRSVPLITKICVVVISGISPDRTSCSDLLDGLQRRLAIHDDQTHARSGEAKVRPRCWHSFTSKAACPACTGRTEPRVAAVVRDQRSRVNGPAAPGCAGRPAGHRPAGIRRRTDLNGEQERRIEHAARLAKPCGYPVSFRCREYAMDAPARGANIGKTGQGGMFGRLRQPAA